MNLKKENISLKYFNSNEKIYLDDERLTNLKRNSKKVASFLSEIKGIKKNKIIRMKNCSNVLIYKNFKEINYRKLFKAFTCKVLLCPLCMTRKSILLKNNLYKVLKLGAKKHELEYIHLVLTQKNCKVEELGKSVDQLLKAFIKLSKRDLFRRTGKGAKDIFKGWYRNLEITFNEEEKTFHPHFHCLLAVKKDYFKNNPNYLTQEKAIKIWRECLNVDYDPTVFLNKIYYLDENNEKVIALQNGQDLKKAVEEVSKYVTKTFELMAIKDEKLKKKVIKNLFSGLAHRRLIAYGGVLKSIKAELKLADEEKADLIKLGEEEIDTSDMEYFIELFKWCDDNKGQYEKFMEILDKNS